MYALNLVRPVEALSSFSSVVRVQILSTFSRGLRVQGEAVELLGGAQHVVFALWQGQAA